MAGGETGCLSRVCGESERWFITVCCHVEWYKVCNSYAEFADTEGNRGARVSTGDRRDTKKIGGKSSNVIRT